MQVHTLSPQNRSKQARRIGRGGKRGTYSGRGIKGQKARAGAKFRPEEREILKKIPKLRGYRFHSFQKRPTIVSIRRVEEKFLSDEKITPEALYQKGLIRKISGHLPKVKVVGQKSTTKSFHFEGVLFSRALQSTLKEKSSHV